MNSVDRFSSSPSAPSNVTRHQTFSMPSRLLHWLMAVLLLCQLLAGVGMITTVSVWHNRLTGLHKPLGICLLIVVIFRLMLRLTGATPSLPATMPLWQRHAATASHYALYILMFAMPILGWAMQSAAGYPLPNIAGWNVPAIASQNVVLYVWLRWAHGIGGQLFFVVVLMHIGAGLLHALVLKDGVFANITWRPRAKRRY